LALLDSGSTHSFISPIIVQKLSLKTHGTTPLSFTTACNATMIFHSICRNTTFYLQGHAFEGDLRVLTVNGYDVLLGMDWISSCGKIEIDCHKGEVRIFSRSKRVVLKSEKSMLQYKLLHISLLSLPLKIIPKMF
jgi:Retroviral aspartyl protease